MGRSPLGAGHSPYSAALISADAISAWRIAISTTDLCETPRAVPSLDEARIGDIRDALGTIRHGDIAPRLQTLLAIVGPGLIVMVSGNDAGALSACTQAGQAYGTTLLWSLMLMVPVLYVYQEMVLRLGVVKGVGYARLILERFSRSAFSVVDLFLLNDRRHHGRTVATFRPAELRDRQTHHAAFHAF